MTLIYLNLSGFEQSRNNESNLNFKLNKLTEKIADKTTVNNEFTKQKSTDENQSIEHIEQDLNQFKKGKLFRLSETIRADFNGDGFLDQAFYKKEKGTSGIIINHGNTNEEVRIGFGRNFASWLDFECNWIDYWGLVEDRKTSKVIFSEDGYIL